MYIGASESSLRTRSRALVPAHIVGPMRRLFLGAFLCLKYQFIEPFIELFRPNFYLSADGLGGGVGWLWLSIVTVAA